ncbi:hypothetical protein GCM10027451_25430 [Geodermatophilus aquaeductus]
MGAGGLREEWPGGLGAAGGRHLAAVSSGRTTVKRREAGPRAGTGLTPVFCRRVPAVRQARTRVRD